MTPTVADDLSFEILKSERVRVRALAILMACLCTASLALLVFDPVWLPSPLLREGVPLGAIATFYACAFAYEMLAQTVLGIVIARRRRLPELPRYLNALIETSIPTCMMVLLSGALGPEIALNTPLVLAYFVFICLSTLRLTASLSIFTGCVAALEYVGLGLYYFGVSEAASTPYFASIWAVFARAVVLVIGGVACAFVATQIRRRLVASLALAQERNRVVGMFGQYVSPAVVERLLSQPVEAAGEVRNVTVMFLDIRGFTAFAERRTPTEVVAYLNTLFATMITLVNANSGIINKFLGDGFMACFGAPLSDGRDTENAVRAAVAIAHAVERMSADGTIAPTRIGIGLHAGPAVTGSVGSAERREYTIIGDTVNLASRVEQLTKQYGAVLLVTDAVWRIVQRDYPGRALEPVTVRGREEPVAIYALL